MKTENVNDYVWIKTLGAFNTIKKSFIKTRFVETG